MQKYLASVVVIATLALAGGAFACPYSQTSASNDPTVVTASAPDQTTAPATTTAPTTTPKKPDVSTGG